MGYLAKKKVKGIMYLYWATESHGERHDEYLGREDDPQAREKANRLQQEALQRRYEKLKEKAAPLGLTFKYPSHGATGQGPP